MKYIYISIFTLLLVASCTELQREEYSLISPDVFPKNENDATALVTDMYGSGALGWFYPGMTQLGMLSDLSSDSWAFAWDGGWGHITRYFQFTTNNSWWIQDRYQPIVQGISRATDLIDKLEEIDMNETLKKRYIAEVRALRSNMAFWGADFYGGVTMILDPQLLEDISGENYVPRSTPDEIYDFIASEVDLIKDDLPDRYEYSDPNYGRMTKGMALTIKLKAMMQAKRFMDAESTAREIMTLGYELVPVYKDIFTVANEGNLETIFPIPSKANLNPGNAYQAHTLAWDYPSKNPSSQAWGVFKIPWNFYDTFDPDDERRKLLISEYVNVSGDTVKRYQGELKNGALPLKYEEDMASTGVQHGNDMIMYRYADVILSLAEAINENNGGPTQEAIDLINMIRQRAFPDDPSMLYSLSDFPDRAPFNDAILAERGWELWGEGFRRQDLIRHGKFIEQAKARNPNAEEHQIVFPLPQWVVNQSEGVISQNPGY